MLRITTALLLLLVSLASATAARAATLYWTEFTAGAIFRVDLDTLEVEPIIPTGLTSPYRIAIDRDGGKIYWTCKSAGTIQRANLDGTELETIVDTGDTLLGIAVDGAGSKVYWSAGSNVHWSNLDGSGAELLFDAGAPGPVQDLALDLVHGKLYLSNWDASPDSVGKVQRVNLDGTGLEDVVTGLSNGPLGLGVDPSGGRVYWAKFNFTDTLARIQSAYLDGSDRRAVVLDVDADSLALDLFLGKVYWTEPDFDNNTGTIRRASLYGSEPETLPLGDVFPGGIAILGAPQVGCPGDLDGDRHVGLADLAQFLGSYGLTAGATYEDGDLDGDRDVDLADLAEMLGLYGSDCDSQFFYYLRTYDEHVEFMQRLVASYPNLAEMINLGLSVEGRPLWALRITGTDDDNPGVMYHGAQHGIEQEGASVVAYAAHYLLSNYGSDPGVAALVDNVEWFLLPIMNPDGYVAMSDCNANGVNLNRNWGGPGSGEDPYGGPYPFSEPETAAMRDFFLAHPNVRVHIDFHMCGSAILHPWLHTDEPCPDNGTFGLVGSGARDAIEDAVGGDWMLWSDDDLSGGSIDYTYGESGIWAFLIELPCLWVVQEHCETALPAMLFLADWIHDCNENGIPDGDEIASGIAADCNGNLVPDECELLAAIEWARLLPPDGAPDCGFGSSLAIAGNTAVVGECCADGQAGRVYVLRFDGSDWVAEASLAASDATPNALFGSSVAVSGNRVLVGAHQADHDGTDYCGAAYVYEFDGTTWGEQAKLVASDAAQSDSFGISVALAGDTALIGAVGDNDNGDYSGSVYVFQFDGTSWVENAKITATDGEESDCFGGAVAICGDTAVIGAHGEGDSGAAYVYEFGGDAWVEQAKLTLSDGSSNARFGESVAVAGDRIVIGAWFQHFAGQFGSGAAYVFGFDGSAWVEQVQLIPPTASVYQFGWAVAFSDDRVIVGATGATGSWEDSGAAFVFELDDAGAACIATLIPSEVADIWGFGAAVAADDETILVGRWPDDFGVAYAYRGLSDCNANDLLDIYDVQLCDVGDANGNGVPDECECWGDLDGDNDVDLSDLAQLLGGYGITEGAMYQDGDLDGDGDVDLADLAEMLGLYGTVCE